MFTGIISAVGQALEARPGRLGVESPETSAALTPGASVAVNGCCLTVTELEGGSFFADLVPETLLRTNLGRLGPGSPVNLELPLRLSQGLDGHLVQGHVDATARVLEVREVDLGREISIELPAELAEFVAEKGSIAVDGTSLTVAGVAADRFWVALIPHTLASTIAGTYGAGTLVNLEVDMVARYLQRLLRETGGGMNR